MTPNNSRMAGRWRQWAGTTLLAALGILAGVVAAIPGAPVWLWIGVAACFAVGAFLIIPIKASRPETETAHVPSAFIRGDAVDVDLQRVDSTADYFVDGNVHGGRMYDIIFRGRKHE